MNAIDSGASAPAAAPLAPPSARVLIVDDERPGRDKLRRLLREQEGVGEVFEARNGTLAVDIAREQAPDVMFLDVQMPDIDGFAVIDALPAESLPHVVFVTAFDRFALRAFEVHAVDYLLKPFDAGRFGAAWRRAVQAVRGRRVAEDEAHVRRMMAELQREGQLPRLERVLVLDGERARLVPVSEIDWIEAHRNYVRLHVRGRVCRARTTIATLESRLDPARFARISRSVLVALDRVSELMPAGHGDYEVRLSTGTRLMLSRRFRDRLNAFEL